MVPVFPACDLLLPQRELRLRQARLRAKSAITRCRMQVVGPRSPVCAARLDVGASDTLEEGVGGHDVATAPAGAAASSSTPSRQLLSEGHDVATAPAGAAASSGGSPRCSWRWPSLSYRSPYDSSILSLALPAMLALAADPLMTIVDTIFVGRTGADALAALGINSALFTFSFLVFSFLATATTPLVAVSLAAGDGQQAGKVTLQALLLASGLGSALAVGLTLGANGALGALGASPGQSGEVYSLAKQFLLIRAAAAPAVLLMMVGQGAFRGMQDMRSPLAITLAANGINFGLDSVLILGLHQGLAGAATATTVAEWAAASAYLGLLWRRRGELGGIDAARTVLASGSMAEVAAEFSPFLQAGGAVLMRTALLLGTKTLASATAARLGPVPIASHQVVMQVWLLSSLIIDSLAVAGQSLVAVELGRGDLTAARGVSNRLLQLGVVVGIALAVCFAVAEPLIPRIFSDDAGVEAGVLSVLPLAVGMLPVNAAVYVLDGILVGASDFGWLAGAMAVAAVTATGLLLGGDPFDLGLRAVWVAMSVLMLSRLTTLLWRYQSSHGPVPPLGLEGRGWDRGVGRK